MKKTILSGLVLLLLAGCTQPATTTNTSNTTATNTAATTAPAGGPLKDEAFNHATLPDTVENMSGTASFLEIVELTTASGKGTTFLLLSSTDPQKGVLVVTAEGKPEDISKKPAGQIKVSGPVKEIEHGNVTATTKSGANLANKAGKIQYVEATIIDWGAAPAGDATGAPGTPAAGETPAPGETPAATGTETPAADATGTPAETPAGDAATPPATPAETPTP